MELGGQVELVEEAKTAMSTWSSEEMAVDPGHPRTPPSIEEGHARYNILAYGCTPTVYRGIDTFHKASYDLLLGSRDFIGGHPRQNSQSLQAVRRMKPFWDRGEDWYDWVEHDDVLHDPVPPYGKYFLVGGQCV